MTQANEDSERPRKEILKKNVKPDGEDLRNREFATPLGRRVYSETETRLLTRAVTASCGSRLMTDKQVEHESEPRNRPTLAFAAIHVPHVAVVLLAHIFIQLFARSPADQKPARPGLGVRAGVVDDGFILERIGIEPRELLNEVQFLGVRNSFAA